MKNSQFNDEYVFRFSFTISHSHFPNHICCVCVFLAKDMNGSSETFDGRRRGCPPTAANHTRPRTFCVLKAIMRYSSDQMRKRERATVQCMKFPMGIKSTQIIKWTLGRRENIIIYIKLIPRKKIRMREAKNKSREREREAICWYLWWFAAPWLWLYAQVTLKIS